MNQDRTPLRNRDFATIAERIGSLSIDQAERIMARAARENVAPWQSALEHGELDATQVDIIKILLAPTESIPGYEILDLIGRGGMGVVYRAQQMSLNRAVALKTILLSQLTNPIAAARFENEAKVLARVTHPHIVAAFDFGRHSGRLFLAMELVQGKDVERLIQHAGPLPEWLVWHLIRQAAAGLAHAAQADVIHRDIKPANLLLVKPPAGFALPSGIPMVKIADFGLSILGEQQQTQARLTSASVHVGSPTYMAPEQLESTDVTPAADIFSLGATAWHMLTGKAPLHGSSLRQLVLQRLTQPTESLTQHVPAATAGTVQLVDEMLKIDPNERLGDYDVLMRRIDQILVRLKPANQSLPLELDTTAFLSSAVMGSNSIDSNSPTQLFTSSTTAVSSAARTDATHASRTTARSRRRRQWLAISTMAVVALVSLVWGVAQWTGSTQTQPYHPQTTTGPRVALFDGHTLAGWSIVTGSWFPTTDAEGATVLQGSNGTLQQDLFSIEFDGFPIAFVLECSCQLVSANSSSLGLQVATEDQQALRIQLELQAGQFTITRQDAAWRPVVIATGQLERPQVAGQAGSRLVGIRLEWHDGRWWMLLDGKIVATFTTPLLSKLTEIELMSSGGATQFSDISLAPLAVEPLSPVEKSRP